METRSGLIRTVASSAIGIALLTAACAGQASPAAAPTTPVRATQSGGGGEDRYGGGYGAFGGGGGGGGVGSGAVAATLKQGPGGAYVFSPAKLTVKKGQTIQVQNVGGIAHTFTISGQGIDVVNDPNQSQEVAITLPPGTYTFVCRFHEGLGMQGALIVKA